MEVLLPLVLKDWETELESSCLQSEAVCLALFDLSGELLYANAAIASLFHSEPSKSIVNPSFGHLCSMPASVSPIFEGFITIGHETFGNTSIKGKAFRKNDKIFLIGYVDVRQLTTQNEVMVHLNNEINELQRQLIREKSLLENTLRQLKEAQSMLVHSEKMNAMGQMVAGVAHEINNPVAFVLSNLYSLNDSFSEFRNGLKSMTEFMEHQHDAALLSRWNQFCAQSETSLFLDDFDEIYRASKDGLLRVKVIVDDLRKFSRLDEAAMKQVDLVDDLKSTISLVSPEFKKRSIAFSFNAPESLWMDCYPSELNQVVLNLLLNAAQAIPAQNGEVSLTLRALDTQVALTVADNGVGIAEDIKPKIFDPFFTTKPVGMGTGLGLSIAYKIVTELHKGSLLCTSEVGKGASFTILIPKNIR